MRRLRRHARCIAALLSSYLLGSDACSRLLGFVNRRLLGGRIATVFPYYPASQNYADLVTYRWHQRRFGWRPGLVGVFFQRGGIGLSFAVPNTETEFKDERHVADVDEMRRRLEAIRARLGARHKTFAGILPSILVGRGIDDPDIEVQRNLTARVVVAALDEVAARHGGGREMPILILGGRGYIARAVVARLERRGAAPAIVEVGELEIFRALMRRWRGHPLIVVNLARAGALAEYVPYLWPSVVVLNEVYPEPSRFEIAAMRSVGSTCYHLAGLPAVVWPPFPRAYRGGLPCCASLPLDDGTPVEVVLTELTDDAARLR